MASLPDAPTLKRLRDEGQTYEHIAQRFGVTAPAVIGKLRRANMLEKSGPERCPLIPWELGPVYRMDYNARMLRVVWRMRQGRPVSATDAKKAERWLESLEGKGQPLVVCFDPQTGFSFLRREPGEDIVRP